MKSFLIRLPIAIFTVLIIFILFVWCNQTVYITPGSLPENMIKGAYNDFMQNYYVFERISFLNSLGLHLTEPITIYKLNVFHGIRNALFWAGQLSFVILYFVLLILIVIPYWFFKVLFVGDLGLFGNAIGSLVMMPLFLLAVPIHALSTFFFLAFQSGTPAYYLVFIILAIPFLLLGIVTSASPALIVVRGDILFMK